MCHDALLRKIRKIRVLQLEGLEGGGAISNACNGHTKVSQSKLQGFLHARCVEMGAEIRVVAAHWFYTLSAVVHRYIQYHNTVRHSVMYQSVSRYIVITGVTRFLGISYQDIVIAKCSWIVRSLARYYH